jgi:PAS domain-containing protein
MARTRSRKDLPIERPGPLPDTLRVVCAWCQRLLSGDIDAPVSHGICASCIVDAEFHRERLDDFLNTLAGPVLVVDADGRLVGSNTVAAALVSSDVASLKGRLCGDVISCEYSTLPGGCGRTIHCTGCAIRRAFEHTAKTGEPVRDRPAFSYSRTPDGPVWKRFTISTERLGTVVLVRIEGGAVDTSGRGCY